MAFTGEEKSSQNPTIATPSTDNSPQQKQEFNAWQLWNMSIGFLGIQFGWGLQMANMSSIFEHLGASAHSIPILWLAAP